MHSHIPDCDDSDGHDRTIEKALEHMLANVEAVAGFDTVTTWDALDRVLYQPVTSPLNLPPHTNSAMDGYALDGSQLPEFGDQAFRVIGSALAGKPFCGAVGSGECVRIMTGAVIPAGTDTVIMQEQVRREDDRAIIGIGHRRGQNVRPAGEDLSAGDTALPAGLLLRPSHLGLIASLGITELCVRRRPEVAFFSTGDELLSVGQQLSEGQIYDSNRYALYAMLKRLNLETLDLGVVRDSRDELEHAFRTASVSGDAIITTGGVSVGEADYVSETLAELGAVDFSTVAIKPGRPVVFGRVGAAPFFGLPGNPVSTMVAFYQLVRPVLYRLMGRLDAEVPVLIPAISDSRINKKPGRREYQRGILSRDADGHYRVSITGKQGSGLLRSMAVANCFIVLSAETGSLEPGARVEVQPFSSIV
ncbi:MAG: gephyrin-like molybdotransferase Glp [Gammaproteobacteria bacterium]|nr:gephyrin-like molybdotransferase Glp [Gammaproteobacteria bacterium]